MPSRYSRSIHIQPIRKITPTVTDIRHTFKDFENVDQLAYKYYKDATLAWVIMSANPQFFHEWEIKPGDVLRIPFPLGRVWTELGVQGEV